MREVLYHPTIARYVWPEDVFARNPAFLITTDTEGDNLWQKYDSITTESVCYLPRFQQLCKKYGFKSVYLTGYEMIIDPFYIEFARDVAAHGTAEASMHLYAWNSLPTKSLTAGDWRHKPYLIEYGDTMIREKVDYMTHPLENTFQTKMASRRTGRWAFDGRYVRLLVEHDYQVDCSVTPRMSWKTAKGVPQGDDGIDYHRFPQRTYFLDENDINREGHSPPLEVPMSIQYKHSAWMNGLRQGYDRLRGRVRSPSAH